MIGTVLEYLKPVVSHYYCSAWRCRVDCQVIVGNKEVLYVVVPDDDVSHMSPKSGQSVLKTKETKGT